VANARVFIDGINLYQIVRETPYRWLDPCQLADLLLDNDDVVEVRYYAPIDPDSERRERQETYLRALWTIPRLTVIEYSPHGLVGRLGADLLEWAAQAQLTGVSLAMSHDSILAGFIEGCWTRHRHLCGIAAPRKGFHPVLSTAAKFRKKVGTAILGASLLPDVLEDEAGEIRKPQTW
jgi:hypothetical protein